MVPHKRPHAFWSPRSVRPKNAKGLL